MGGAVHILHLDRTGYVRSFNTLSAASGLPSAPAAGDYFGQATAPAGDWDSDGVPDLVIASPLSDDGGRNTGAIDLCLMRADGTVREMRRISALTGGFGIGLDTGDNFGHSVAPAADWDGNGVPDLATGANADDNGGTDSGSFSILLLNADATVKRQFVLNATNNAFPGVTIPASDRFSRTVAYLGDHRGDGTHVFAIGAGAHTTGHVWILHFDPFALWGDDLTSGQASEVRLMGGSPHAQTTFAWSLAGPGPTASPWGMLSLSAPYFLETFQAVDANGSANWPVTIPAGAQGTQVWLQGGELAHSTVRLSEGLAEVLR